MPSSSVSHEGGRGLELSVCLTAVAAVGNVAGKQGPLPKLRVPRTSLTLAAPE